MKKASDGVDFHNALYREVEIEKSEKQSLALRTIKKNTTTLLEGGGRSGKTFIICYAFVWRCIKYPGSRHLMIRFRFAHIKQAVAYDTMPEVLRILGMEYRVHLNRSDWFYEFPNGSMIWLGGIDDRQRTEKILGNEYATIFLNEASQISFEAYEMLLTRLNTKIPGLVPRIIIDYNPPSISHWGYQIFHKRQFPDGRPVPKNDFGVIRMNPTDNPYLDEGYVKRMSMLSSAKRKRFLDGEYSLDAGKLWKRAWIKYHAGDLPDFVRVLVGVDPSGSVDGDEIGIIVTGEYILDKNVLFMVLDDYSMHGTPAEWAAEVAAAYRKYQADAVIAEKNYGGDMVGAVIANADPSVNVRLVTATRGKVVRAEPISALYEHGRVTHRIPFMEMEDEICTYDPETAEKSPNRMDALVWSLTEFTSESVSILDAL